jgi:uncharacterized protein (TIGR02147 family)
MTQGASAAPSGGKRSVPTGGFEPLRSKAGQAIPTLRSVFEFIDYRKYLDHHYQEKKKKNRKFSYRYFAMKAGITSPSFLKMVIDGKRNLTSGMIEKFCRALELDGKEAKYFTNLVHFNQAKTAREKQDFYAALRAMGDLIKEEVLRINQYDYFDKWYTPIIRELLGLGDFQEDFDLLGRTVEPPVSPAEAKAAVLLLLKLGLVERKENGRYAPTKLALAGVNDDSVVSLSLRTYQEYALEHAKRAMYDFDKRVRHISTMVLGVSPAAYGAMVEEINAFKDRIKAIVHRDEASTRVYQFTLALFPVSKDAPRPAAVRPEAQTRAGHGLEALRAAQPGGPAERDAA